MIAAFGYYGFYLGGTGWVKWIFGLGLPLIVVIFWGIFMAPQASSRLPWPILPIIALVLFLASSILLYMAGGKTLAIAMAATSVVNAVLTLLWHQY